MCALPTSQLLDAMRTMIDLDTAAGRAQFETSDDDGSGTYHGWNDWAAQHLALSARRDGDQLHDGIGFLTAHVALSNAFERSLQVRRRARWCVRLTRFFCDGAAVHRGRQPL